MVFDELLQRNGGVFYAGLYLGQCQSLHPRLAVCTQHKVHS